MFLQITISSALVCSIKPLSMLVNQLVTTSDKAGPEKRALMEKFVVLAMFTHVTMFDN